MRRETKIHRKERDTSLAAAYHAASKEERKGERERESRAACESDMHADCGTAVTLPKMNYFLLAA